MKLVIVESPNKRKKISEYLGPGWRVEASVGHIADLPKKQMGISMPGHQPNYQLTDRGKEVISRLKGIVKETEEVYIATDPDREGEAIAAHLEMFLGLSDPKRIVFHEITQAAVTKAIQSPKKIDKKLFDAQQGRRVTDRYTGFLVSPKLSDLAGQKLSAGRVQSIAVRLLVERERAIKKFKETLHFSARLEFPGKSMWCAIWNTKAFVTEDEPYILDKSMAEVAAGVKELTVDSVIKKQHQQKAPAPFITTTLQKAGSIVLNLGADESMKVAQTLFEKGLISYHRTDNPNLSDDALSAIQIQLTKDGFREHLIDKPNKYRSKAGSQEAHEAIRPTDFSKAVVSTGDLKADKLYQLIRTRALASQMKHCLTDVTTVTLVANETLNKKPIIFIAKAQKISYVGWRLLTKDDQSEENKEEIYQNPMPKLKKGDKLKPISGRVLNLKTKPPRRYTEPSLISKLEKEGIGRPSTYAAILKNIQTRGYVVLKGKNFEATQTAEVITDTLTGKFSFMEIEYTRNLEESLDKIASGKTTYLEVVSGIEKELQKNLMKIEMAHGGKLYPCPECDAPLRRLQSKNKSWFWGCSRYREGCKTTVSDADGKPAIAIEGEKIDNPCPECSKPLNRIKGKKGFFWGCTGFKSGCKFITDDNRGKPAKVYHCLKCKKRLRKINNKQSIFWGCTGYPNCKATYSDKKGKPVFSGKQICAT